MPCKHEPITQPEGKWVFGQIQQIAIESRRDDITILCMKVLA